MSSEGSITSAIDSLRHGEATPAEEALWNRYFERLVLLAREVLRSQRRVVVDEEDVALSAMNALYEGIRRRQFPQLRDRHNLWSLLVAITRHKAIDRISWAAREKRRVRLAEDPSLSALLSHEPTPGFVAQVVDEYQRFLHSLPDDELRVIAQHRAEAFTVSEIADEIGRCKRTVERKLQLIRTIWTTELE